jgi:hypothetical protein
MTEKRPLTFTIFMLRLLSGITGGAAGMLVAFIVYFLMILFVPAGEGVTSLSIFTVMIMAFVGTLMANTITAVMLTIMDAQKYSRRKTTITHVFIFNLVLFFLSVPVYLLASALNIVTAVVALHFLLSAFVSALIMEVLAGYEFSLLGIYGASLGIFVSIVIAFIALATSSSQLSITLGAMPMVWMIMMIVSGFAELVYDNFLAYYGVDALNVKTDLGGDTETEPKEGEEEPEEEPEEK